MPELGNLSELVEVTSRATPLRVSILAKSLVNWAGGRDYLRLCMAGIAAVDSAVDFRLFLPKQTFLRRSRRAVGRISRMAISSMNGRSLSRAKPDESVSHFLNTIDARPVPVLPIVCRDSRKAFARTLLETGTDVVLPVLTSLGSGFPVPWIGYIPDCQHRHLPGLFSARERRHRDRQFGELVRDAKVLVLNSQAVADDVLRFYPEAKCRIFVLPFAPVPDVRWLENEDETLATRFSLPKRFFLISNQFWVHKSHITAFEALKLLRQDSHYQDVEILCTGETHDYRWPRHFEELDAKVKRLGIDRQVRYLGHISKLDQIGIMRRATALIQPTLFEGGPGGGSVYDALAVGTRAIVSDIPVNLEIRDSRVTFFQARSAEDLADAMRAVLEVNSDRITPEQLKRQGISTLQSFGGQLMKAVRTTMDAGV